MPGNIKYHGFWFAEGRSSIFFMTDFQTNGDQFTAKIYDDLGYAHCAGEQKDGEITFRKSYVEKENALPAADYVLVYRGKGEGNIIKGTYEKQSNHSIEGRFFMEPCQNSITLEHILNQLPSYKEQSSSQDE